MKGRGLSEAGKSRLRQHEEGRRVHIANVSKRATHADLVEFFSNIGPVEAVRRPHASFVFVLFQSKTDAATCVAIGEFEFQGSVMVATLSHGQDEHSERPGLDEDGRQPNAIIVSGRVDRDKLLLALEEEYGRIVHFRPDLKGELVFLDFARAADGRRLIEQKYFEVDGVECICWVSDTKTKTVTPPNRSTPTPDAPSATKLVLKSKPNTTATTTSTTKTTTLAPTRQTVSRTLPVVPGVDQVCEVVTKLILNGKTDFFVLEGAVKSLGVNFGSKEFPFKTVDDFFLARTDLYSRYGDEVSLSKREKKRLNLTNATTQPKKMQQGQQQQQQQHPPHAQQSQSSGRHSFAEESPEIANSSSSRSLFSSSSPTASAELEKCSRCHKDNVPDFKFCCHCGSKAERGPPKCGGCGAENLPNYKFCSSCGHKREP